MTDRPSGGPKITAADGHSEPRVVRKIKGGPVLVEGPVRIVADDGTEVEADRFVVAVCRCRRSDLYPICDTSHRALRTRRTQ